MSILRTENLEACYEKKTVFQDLNITIAEGKITTIIGPNGCGKSTLLKAMGRILKQTHGKVFLQEQDMNTISTKEIAKRLSMLPQSPSAPGLLGVEELISYGRFPHRKNTKTMTKEDQEIIEWAMEATKTLEFRNRSIASLSGGQRQKVWLAMALAQKTDIILLDEPTTYLDMAHQLDVLQTVKDLNRQQQCTIVMVLHDINHAARYSDIIVAMKDGNIIKTGTPCDIIDQDVLKEVFQINARIIIDPHDQTPVCIGYSAETARPEARSIRQGLGGR